MLYREIIAVCSQIHTKHINTLYGHNVEFQNVKLLNEVTAGLVGLDQETTCLFSDFTYSAAGVSIFSVTGC